MKEFKLKKEDIKKLIDWKGPEGCLATDRITVNGCKISYMYRENPDEKYPDSGWRFLEGTEDEEYMNNPNNMGVYALNTICNYDPDIIPFLEAPYGSAFNRDKKGKFKIDEQGVPKTE